MKPTECAFVELEPRTFPGDSVERMQPSVLIPFPEPVPTTPEDSLLGSPPVDHWRAELKEKVRAIRARREIEAEAPPMMPRWRLELREKVRAHLAQRGAEEDFH